MPRAPRLSGRAVINALRKSGFEVTRVRGSHHMLTNEGGQLVVVLVHGNDALPPGTLRAILNQADLSVEQLIDLLK